MYMMSAPAQTPTLDEIFTFLEGKGSVQIKGKIDHYRRQYPAFQEYLDSLTAQYLLPAGPDRFDTDRAWKLFSEKNL